MCKRQTLLFLFATIFTVMTFCEISKADIDSPLPMEVYLSGAGITVDGSCSHGMPGKTVVIKICSSGGTVLQSTTTTTTAGGHYSVTLNPPSGGWPEGQTLTVKVFCESRQSPANMVDIVIDG